MYRLDEETEEDWWEVEALYDLCFAPGRTALSSYRLRDGVPTVAALCLTLRDGDGTLAALEARRVEWRAKREANEVDLTTLMPLHTDAERRCGISTP